MFNEEKIKLLLAYLDFQLELTTEPYVGKNFLCLSLKKGEKIIGKCFFREEEEEEDYFWIERIDINENSARSKGYGSLLLYATLYYMQKNDGDLCKLIGLTNNYSFYMRNGFHDLKNSNNYAFYRMHGFYDPENANKFIKKNLSEHKKLIYKIAWYQLSVAEKNEILYANMNYENEDRETYFSSPDNEHEIDIDLQFSFEDSYAIDMANSNIDRLIMRCESEIAKIKLISPILDLYETASTDKIEAFKTYESRYRFLNGTINKVNEEFFKEDMENILSPNRMLQ